MLPIDIQTVPSIYLYLIFYPTNVAFYWLSVEIPYLWVTKDITDIVHFWHITTAVTYSSLYISSAYSDHLIPEQYVWSKSTLCSFLVQSILAAVSIKGASVAFTSSCYMSEEGHCSCPGSVTLHYRLSKGLESRETIGSFYIKHLW